MKLSYLSFILSIIIIVASTIDVDDQFITALTGQLEEWVGYISPQATKQAIQKCGFEAVKPNMSKFYNQLAAAGMDFSLKHIDVIRKFMKEDQKMKQVFKCYVDGRLTDNAYFNQQKKYKYLARFVKEYDTYGKAVFPELYGIKEKGRLIGHFFKAFFQYYYMNVHNPSETLSTEFIRSLTARSKIFQHLDISYCLSVDTVGDISKELEGLDINNIYQNLPRFWKAFKYLKFKERCKDQKHLQIAKKLQQAIGDIDIYRLMYHDYEPYVQIAAEKFGTAQIRMLSKKVAEIIANSQKYKQLSQKQF